jgi:hypothetical protein
MLTSLLIDGTLVTRRGRLIFINALCDCQLRPVPPANTYRGGYIKLTWLDINLKTPIQMR